ncbi:MAG: hypothetical protein Q9223_002563 [Gallowayella weberi]
MSFLFHRMQTSQAQSNDLKLARSERSVVSEALAETLPDSVFFGPDSVFIESVKSYWAMQEREIVPQCIVRPRSVQELATTLTILKRDYDTRTSSGGTPMVFAVRSGGHSPMPGSANTHDGIVIDLRLLNKVIPSEDSLSVTFGTGAKWVDVYKALDERGLAVAGGRNSDVGVGGLTLGGGLSFFSPRVGFVCNNILSYEIVLANGTITTASESTNPGLWRALKGGSNNFGIVTSFVARTFPSTDVWSGFLYMRGSKADQMVRAFYEFTQHNPSTYDEYAAGPLACFSYVQKLRLSLIATYLVYTKPQSWPTCFDGFKSIGRLWSTVKQQSLTSATNEVASSSPAGLRQLFITTTVKNDLVTLREVHAAYKRGVLAMKFVKGMTWTLVLQPLLPVMARKGQADSQGLAGRTEPLVIVLFTVVWERNTDDDLVHRTTRDIIDEIDEFADVQGTSDPYRYLNDCASWQNPFDGYGAENKRFLQQMSKIYDPDGLFQRACSGGFKLGMDGSN